MNARVRPATSIAVAPPAQATCATCATYAGGICLAAAAWPLPSDASLQVGQSAHSVAARRIICREQELHDAVPLICEGWAASLVMLSDGSRQILSFLLPGDIVSASLFFDVRPHCSVEAITDVSYRSLNRAEFRTSLFKNPDLFERLLKTWTEETLRADQLIVDLGRRSADERIARLILNLAERLAERGMVQSETMEMDFPLRQHHIADATGLTPVHVSKVLTEFRRHGLLNISDRSLTVLDPMGFRRIANLR
jgi:CRP/FNR family transcriptional regulator, anaerobic regulatory protein